MSTGPKYIREIQAAFGGLVFEVTYEPNLGGNGGTVGFGNKGVSQEWRGTADTFARIADAVAEMREEHIARPRWTYWKSPSGFEVYEPEGQWFARFRDEPVAADFVEKKNAEPSASSSSPG